MGKRSLEITAVSSPLKAAFAISRGAKTSAETIRVSLREGGAEGRGECVPYGRYGETVDGVIATIEQVRAELEAGMSRAELQNRLPAALEQFEVATRLAPDAFQAWNNCAAIHDAFGRGREAIAAAERAVAAAAARQAPEVAVLRERLAGYRRKWGG